MAAPADKAVRLDPALRFARLFLTGLFALFGGAGVTPAGAQKMAPGCDAEGGRAASVTGINERLELMLDSGVRLRLAGIEPPRATAANPGLHLESRRALSSWLVGLEIKYAPLGAAPDRWGRQEAHAAAPVSAGGPLLSVAGALLDAGLVRAAPEASARSCMTEYLRQEQQARGAGLGLWSDPAYAVLDTRDRGAFADRGGETIIAEGEVTGIGETGFRTYVNFGPIRTVDFTVTFRRQSLKLFEAGGLRAAELTGQRLRVRGQLDTRFGPRVEIAEPSAVEFLSGGPRLPQSRPLARR